MADESTPVAQEAAPTIALRGRAVHVEIRSAGLQSDRTEEVGLIFDCNVMADIEDTFNDGYRGFVRYDSDEDGHKQGDKVLNDDGSARRDTFYGMEAWQASMTDRPFWTIRKTIALALGIPDREAGQRLIEERLPDYFTAVGAAFAIANGVDPTSALEQAIAGMAKMRAELAAQAEAAAAAREARDQSEKPAIPGQSGSERGDAPEDPSQSSGS